MWSRIDGSSRPRGRARRARPRRRSSPAATATTSCSRSRRSDALRPHGDRFGVEARQVEQLLDERGHAHRLLLERDAELRLLLVVEPVAEVVQRLHEAVDRRHRCAQLVRGERDEVRHHLVRALEPEPRLVLLLEEPHAVERDAGHRGDGLQHPQLVVAEEGRVRRRPHEEAGAGSSIVAPAPRPAVAAPRSRAVATREQRRRGVEDRRGAGADQRRDRRRARGRRSPRASSRASSGRGSPPAGAAARGARQSAHEPGGASPSRNRAPRRSASSCRPSRDGRVVAALEGRADDRDRQRRGGEREQAHARSRRPAGRGPPARAGRVTTTESSDQWTRKTTT